MVPKLILLQLLLNNEYSFPFTVTRKFLYLSPTDPIDPQRVSALCKNNVHFQSVSDLSTSQSVRLFSLRRGENEVRRAAERRATKIDDFVRKLAQAHITPNEMARNKHSGKPCEKALFSQRKIDNNGEMPDNPASSVLYRPMVTSINTDLDMTLGCTCKTIHN